MGKQDMLVNTMQHPLNFKRKSIVWTNDFEAIIPTQFLQSPFWIFVMYYAQASMHVFTKSVHDTSIIP